jgi:hypothetical protein
MAGGLAVRSEQLTVCQARYGPELYGKTIRIDDDPPTLFVVAPARTRQAGGRGYSDGRLLVGGQRPSDLYRSTC